MEPFAVACGEFFTVVTFGGVLWAFVREAGCFECAGRAGRGGCVGRGALREMDGGGIVHGCSGGGIDADALADGREGDGNTGVCGQSDLFKQEGDEGFGKGACGGEAGVFVFGESAVYDGLEAGIDVHLGGEGLEGRGLGFDLLDQYLVGGAAVEGASREEFDEQYTSGVDIGTAIDLFDIAASLFGRHITRSADSKARFGEGWGIFIAVGEDASDAEVEDLEGASVVGAFDQDEVFGFEIAVNDALAVGKIEGTEKLLEDLDQDVAGWDTKALDMPLKGFAFEPLHDQERAETGHMTEVDDLNDIFVAESSKKAGFAFESLDHEGVSGKVRMEDLDGKRDGEVDMFGAVDGAKASATDLVFEAILSDDSVDQGIFCAAQVGATAITKGRFGAIGFLASRTGLHDVWPFLQ